MPEFKLKSKNKKLLSQIAKGNAEKVSKLISKGANLNKNDERGWSPLHVASMRSNAGVVKAILSGSSITNDIDDVTGDGFSNTALHIASGNGHNDIVKLLLEKGANPNKENHAQETPLHVAAWSDNSQIDILKLLIEEGANVDSRNGTHDTPLHCAALKERIHYIKLLLSVGADVAAKNSKGETALDYSKNENIRILLKNHIQEKKMIRFKRELDFKLDSKPGYSPLHTTSEQGCYTKVETILKSGVDVNKKTDPLCFTALHLASANGHKDIVELLLENEANINARNKDGKTPLHTAIRSTHCNEDIVQLLIERGANINSKTKSHNTPLHYAAQNSHKAVVKILLDAGAVLDARNNKGKMAFHYAKDQDIRSSLQNEHNEVDYHNNSSSRDISDTASTSKTNSSCSTYSTCSTSDSTSGDTSKESREDYENKIEAKQKSCSVDKSGRSPLHIAAEKGCIVEVQNILELGADVNQKTSSHFTALHLACSYGHKDIVNLLLESRADIEAENQSGNTSLHIATRSVKPREDIVKLLIDRGANINAKTKRLYTPLHYAAKYGYEAVVKLLYDSKAIVDVKNNRGETPLDIAKNEGIRDILS